jgi:tetratricopeptide (TPR) repeat protein
MQRIRRQDQAITLYQSMLRRSPSDPDILRLLGVAYAQLSEFDKALRVLRISVRCGPCVPETHNNLGRVLQGLRRYEEAILAYECAVELRPDYALALNNLGTALAELNRHGEAIERYGDALRAQPDYPQALGNMGVSHHALGQHQEAIDYLLASLDLQPSSIDTLTNLAKVHAHIGRDHDASRYFDTALRIAPDRACLHIGMADTLHRAGKHLDAIRHYRRALEIEPKDAHGYASLGSILQELGQIAEAIVCYRSAIALSPRRPGYYLELTRMVEFPDDSLLVAMLGMANEIGSLTESEQTDLHFALGAALDRLGHHERAFRHWLSGNALRRKSLAYDENVTRSSIDRVRKSFPPALGRVGAKEGHQTITPIFIVGMPRSGSTLVEQVLVSHSKVFGAGEVSDLSEAMRKAGLNTRSSPFPKSIGSCAVQQLEELARDYLDRLAARLRNGADHRPITHITDKMLENFRYVGLILKTIPNAKVIHTKRDPVDTCISCFSLHFRSVEFSYDLGELGRYYASYDKLMEYWHSIASPGAILDVQYEDTVKNLETQARRILDYCGLEWDDACLRFHQTERPVRTSSLIQVRRPIYSSSVGKWRPEHKILRPLLEGLAHIHVNEEGGN